MTPPQLFVYAVVTSLSIPCIATLAALRGGSNRAAFGICAALLALALGCGMILARLFGIA